MQMAKDMIHNLISGVFIQIREYAQRSGYHIDDIPSDIKRIENELDKLKFLLEEYKKAPDDWRDEFNARFNARNR